MPQAVRKQTKKKEEVKAKTNLSIEIVKQMLTLSTGGFGLVAALAWNSLIQEVVNNYIKKFLPANSGIISLLVYALVVTILAVIVTLQLTRLKQRLEGDAE